MGKRGKGKSVRKRSKKSLERRRQKSKKYKSSSWKLKYSGYFKEVSEFPYIVRINKNKK